MYAGSSIACEGVFMNVLDFFFLLQKEKKNKRNERSVMNLKYACLLTEGFFKEMLMHRDTEAYCY